MIFLDLFLIVVDDVYYGCKFLIICDDLLVVVLVLIGLYCSVFMLSLCEVVCEVGIVLNLFYCQFCDMDELIVVLIDLVG